MPSAAALAALATIQEEKASTLTNEVKNELIAKAKSRVNAIVERGNIYDAEAENKLVRFDRDELQIGRKLGMGGFCKVSEVSAIHIPIHSHNHSHKHNQNHYKNSNRYSSHDSSSNHSTTTSSTTKPLLHSREYMAMQCIRQQGGARYAIKELSSMTKSDPDTFLKGMADIVIEARLLAVIQHENIIKIRGYGNCYGNANDSANANGNPTNANDSTSSSNDYFDPTFFLVMDRLHITLDKQIIRWREDMNTCSMGMMCFFSKKRKESLESIMDDKLTVAMSIAGALEFLHSKNIIYRDLKPENIGMDVRENVKLFDFGLAAEVDTSNALRDGTFKLTGYTGSPLYMAPEVAKSLPYNFAADVYSFGILLWQIMSMKTPFDKLTRKALFDFVVNGNYRPPIDEDGWSPNLCLLMRSCWSGDFASRPKFSDVKVRLQNEGFGDYTTGDNLDVSTKSYNAIMSRLNQDL